MSKDEDSNSGNTSHKQVTNGATKMDDPGIPAKIPRTISTSEISNSIFNACNYSFDHDANQLIKQEIKEEPLEIKEEIADDFKSILDAKDAEILKLQEENISLKMEKNELEQKNIKLQATILELQSKQTNQTLLLEQNNQGLKTDLALNNEKVTRDKSEMFSTNHDQLRNHYQDILRENDFLKKRLDEMSSLIANLEEKNKKLTNGNQELSEEK